MYEYMKLLQQVSEQIGTVENCKCKSLDAKYYDHDIVEITGMTNDGYAFELSLKVSKNGENQS